MRICVIPARGGSKRIPRKNIREFCGKPMIAYAIDAAKASDLFEHIIVSTEDKEVGAIARQYGAETPFIRPPELADDHTPTAPVIAHAITACQLKEWNIEFACCIYPGVPFIRPSDLASGLELLKASGATFCFPVTEFPSAIQRSLRRSHDGRITPFYPENELTRTQDLEPAYHDAGQFYWGHVKTWLNQTRLHSGGVGLLIPSWRVVDIDTPEDWIRAEKLFHALL